MQVKEPIGRKSGGWGRTRQGTKSGVDSHHKLVWASGHTPGPGTLRVSLLWISELGCSSAGGHHTWQGFALPHEKSSQRGLEGDVLCVGRVEGVWWRWKPEGTASFLQGIRWDQTTAGNSSLTTHPRRVQKDLSEPMLTWVMCANLFEARFINRVSREDYRIPILCLTKPLKCK